MIDRIKTNCPRDCYDGCGIVVERRDDGRHRVLGDPDHPVSRGTLCGKCVEICPVIDEAALQFGIWCHKGSPAFAGREEQSREAATIAADAYYGRLRLLDTLASETPGTFLAGEEVTIADCIAMATLQFAEKLYGVPLPEGCAVLHDWYEMFSKRPSAAAPSYPKPLLAVAQGLPNACPPTLP